LKSNTKIGNLEVQSKAKVEAYKLATKQAKAKNSVRRESRMSKR